MKKIILIIVVVVAVLIGGILYYLYFNSKSPSPFRLISPNGGEVMQQGSTRTVTWIYTGPQTNRPTRLFIIKGPVESPQFAQAFASVSTVSGTEQTFDWQVPSDFPDGNDYKIEVDLGKVADNDVLYYDLSDSQFSLSPK